MTGVTKRPASWPTREAAEKQVAYWKDAGSWNSTRDPVHFDYEIREHSATEES